MGWGRTSCDLNLDSVWRRGKEGVGILWRKELDLHVNKLDNVGNDRKIAIRLKAAGDQELVIIGAYFPVTNHSLELYRT